MVHPPFKNLYFDSHIKMCFGMISKGGGQSREFIRTNAITRQTDVMSEIVICILRF